MLAVLAAGTNRPLTGREVQRLARRGSHTGVQRILTRMAEHGLLDVADAGSARLYTLNREHVAATAALALLDLRAVPGEHVELDEAAFVEERVDTLAAGELAAAAVPLGLDSAAGCYGLPRFTQRGSPGAQVVGPLLGRVWGVPVRAVGGDTVRL